ncbi:glycosyltransferase family A protein [Sutcliffiella deserti]|uniref:glycosyltransferase family A protein n=1 Tax=Sutcliffiella deserti TaxID=2875501 RepID=UPI001CBFD1D6|nr:glycosyltransferase family A protein [Sutcliffiella deserti]
MDKVITIITPTFNREHTLYNCFDSLKAQTDKRFLWMVVDDGSTDNTEDLVHNWISENIIEIQYFKKNNGGKASALNFALDRIDTDYWVCLDSDDTFSHNSIELALDGLEKIKSVTNYCGLLALRNAKSGEVFGGKRIPKEVVETTVLELSDKYKIRSEFVQFYITEITSGYRFPEISGEKFMPPEYLANELNKKYKFKVEQKIFCYCEYLPDGLTRNKLEIIKNNPRGYTLVVMQAFELTDNFYNKSKRCLKYISGCLLSGDRNCIRNSPHKIMTTLYYPFGWLVYKYRFGK